MLALRYLVSWHFHFRLSFHQNVIRCSIRWHELQVIPESHFCKVLANNLKPIKTALLVKVQKVFLAEFSILVRVTSHNFLDRSCALFLSSRILNILVHFYLSYDSSLCRVIRIIDSVSLKDL